MKQQVLELIFANPNIRTVEISDKLDIAPDAVRPLIAPEIASGAIVEEPIIAPNGREVLSFRFASAQPKAAPAPAPAAAPVPARVARAIALPRNPAAPVAAPASNELRIPRLDDAPLDIDVPVTRKEGVPLIAPAAAAPERKPSRVERAIECLRGAEGVPVPTEMLARAMGLPPKQHPSSYLKDAMHDGRVTMKAKMWALGPALREQIPPAVELPAPIVKPRAAAKPATPAPLEFPRADPDELAAFDPATKECTMNCGPHRDDPRTSAERKLLCDDCLAVDQVAPAPGVEQIIAESEDAMDRLRASACETCGCLPCGCAAAEVPELAPAAAEDDAPARLADLPAAQWEPTGESRAVGVQAFDGLSMVKVPTGGLPNIKTPFLPTVASGAPDITRPGLYENGEFRKSPAEVLGIAGIGMRGNVSENVRFWGTGGLTIAANDVRLGVMGSAALTQPPEKFLAGVMSDGSLEIRTPGKPQLNLAPEQARELYLFLRTMGYAAWPTEG